MNNLCTHLSHFVCKIVIYKYFPSFGLMNPHNPKEEQENFEYPRCSDISSFAVEHWNNFSRFQNRKVIFCFILQDYNQVLPQPRRQYEINYLIRNIIKPDGNNKNGITIQLLIEYQ